AVTQCAFAQVQVIDVGDFQLATPRRFQSLDLFEDRIVEHINSGNGILRFGLLGLLFDAQNASIGNFGAAKALGIVDLFQDNVSTAFLPGEDFRSVQEIIFDDVVAKHHANRLAIGEVLSQPQRVGNAAFAFLVGIVHPLQAKIFAVGQQPQEIPGIVAAGDDQNLGYADVHQGLDGVVNHGQVVYRQQMLIGNPRKRQQTRTQPACQNYTLHRASKISSERLYQLALLVWF